MEDNQTGSEQRERKSESEMTPRLSDDQLYRALVSTRRRRLLYSLLAEGETTIDQLATTLAGWDATETDAMTRPDEYEQIVVELDHKHLPLLADTGLIAYDRESGTVRIEPLDTSVRTLIDRSVEAEPSSPS